MSIKGAVKRLEGVMARKNGRHSVTFVIPHFKDLLKSEQIKNKLISEHGLANRSDVLLVFVVDFALTGT